MHKPLFVALFVATTTIHAADNQVENNEDEILECTIYDLDMDENGVEFEVGERESMQIPFGSMMHNAFFTNVKNKNGETSLMIAARKGNKAEVEKILSCNPNITLENSEGKTAAALAREHGHLSIVYSINLHRFYKTRDSL